MPTLPTAPDATRTCATCGTVCGVQAVTYGPTARLVWEVCQCKHTAIAEAAARCRAAADRYQAYASSAARADTPLDDFIVKQGMAWAAFRADDLPPSDQGRHPWPEANAWLTQVLLHRPDRPAQCAVASALYLHSATRGNGKTHAAVALAERATAAEWPVAILEEERFAPHCWALDIDGQNRQIARFAQMPGLLIIDDIGRREPSRGLRNLYDALICRRYTDGGWTIVTSNFTPTELLSDGVINESTFSRLGSLIDRRLLGFDGYDHRLQNHA